MRATPSVAWRPLQQCVDADLVDTTEMDIEAAVAAVMTVVEAQGQYEGMLYE
jgi:cytidylate kinase